jgi:hypothetical protein
MRIVRLFWAGVEIESEGATLVVVLAWRGNLRAA